MINSSSIVVWDYKRTILERVPTSGPASKGPVSATSRPEPNAIARTALPSLAPVRAAAKTTACVCARVGWLEGDGGRGGGSQTESNAIARTARPSLAAVRAVARTAACGCGLKSIIANRGKRTFESASRAPPPSIDPDVSRQTMIGPPPSAKGILFHSELTVHPDAGEASLDQPRAEKTTRGLWRGGGG
ncbi:hypothetical protein T492DRAFT_841017 [Pavlovales sp. CCMP2436]|nr:hypothetical protein T492DRAFT_841017 [Pavlovales sp. CCMP2436]